MLPQSGGASGSKVMTAAVGVEKLVALELTKLIEPTLLVPLTEQTPSATALLPGMESPTAGAW